MELFRPATEAGERLWVGQAIEARAWDWLVTEGLKAGLDRALLVRGFRCRAGELDLVFEEKAAGRGTELVFAEVRSRLTWHDWRSGLEAVSFTKRQRLERAARVYLARYRGGARQLRWDIVFFDGQVFSHFVDAWRSQ
jgi:Holliday junction resolvase-like predicted endonuclease